MLFFFKKNSKRKNQRQQHNTDNNASQEYGTSHVQSAVQTNHSHAILQQQTSIHLE